MNLTEFDKAVAGGLVTALVAWLSHYGVTLSPLVHDFVASVALTAVTYVFGHVIVYFAKNKNSIS